MATGLITFPLFQVTGEIKNALINGEVQLPSLSVLGNISNPIVTEATFPALQVTGTIETALFITGNVFLPSLSMAGAVVTGRICSGSATFPRFSLTGRAIVNTESTANIIFPTILASGDVVVDKSTASRTLTGTAELPNLQLCGFLKSVNTDTALEYSV